MKYSATGSNSFLKSAISTAALGAALAGGTACADTVTNPGFETGDTSGWTTSGGKWYSGTWPVPEFEYAGPATLLSMQSAGTLDPITGVPTVFAGNYAVRLNDSVGGNDITAIRQTVNSYTGNKLYYAWNAVLEPSHGATDSPSFIIKVVDKTTNTIVTNVAYSAYTAQNTTIFRNAANFVTSDWKVEDVDMTSGHDYDLIFVAVDCLYGGHAGYVYVDGFGNAIPVPNANVNFDPSRDVYKGSAILIPITGALPDMDLTRAFYTTSDITAGLVNAKFLGGTLRVDSANAVANTFTVDALGGVIDTNGFDVVFSGGFGGAGSLVKTGLGTLTLTSFASTLNGSFAVNQGTLAVNDALSALTVDVGSGGTLSGSGSVIADINVNAGGTLAPGAGVGNFSIVAGDVTLADTATLALDLDGRTFSLAGGPGSYDRLTLMTGSTFTPNGVLSARLRGITGGNNTFTPVIGDTFTVVTGGAIGTGAFDSVVQPTAGLAPNTRLDVIYNPTSVVLAVTPGRFGTWGAANGWKANAVSAATGLDPFRPAAGARTGTWAPLFNGIYGQDNVTMAQTFSQLSGEVHADAMQMAQSAARDVGQVALSAARQPWGCSPEPQTPGQFQNAAPASADDGCGAGSTSKGATVWGRWLGASTEGGADGIAYEYRNKSHGLIAGFNVVNQDGTRLGLGASYSDGDLNSKVGASADIDTTSFFLYGAHRIGAVSLGLVGSYSSTDVDTERTVGLTTGTLTATGSGKIHTLSGSIEARYDAKLGSRMVLRPVVGMELGQTTAKRFTEAGAGTIALTLPKEKWTSARTKVGAELAVGVGNPVEVGVHANWHHELKDPTAVRVAQLGAASWVVSSVDADKDSFDAGASVSVKVTNGIKLHAGYGITRSGSYHVDTGTAGLSIKF